VCAATPPPHGTSMRASPLHPRSPPNSSLLSVPRLPPCWAAGGGSPCSGDPVTHRALDGPEGEEVLGPVAAVPAPGLPPGIVTFLQDELLPLVLGVLEAHPAGGERSKALSYAQRSSQAQLRAGFSFLHRGWRCPGRVWVCHRGWGPC